ncbi:mechanosensitive ion channel family protein [Alteraurantiacibacter aquimixticola]|uniref:Mechanosensitive ion channel n=1 Tax=Alteraurantiacibacter aquimixticola TaxID=2489173 RepID=A0A4T3F2C6_9SPHN|nr:mechanosensitive ion channel domain-containing protein [Alteraurantiacibacter aquimixticola]TIX51395.1 mechanosensitive ion channel [Alteraurantiacibacter aquimixticola]
MTAPVPEILQDPAAEGETPDVAGETPTVEADPIPVAPDMPQPEDGMAGADALREAVSEQSMTIANIVEKLDSFGFSIDETRISAWSILVVIMVILGVIAFARVFSRLAHKLLAKLTAFDASQRLLGEKLLTIAVWAFAILIGIDMLGIDLTALAVFSGAFGLAIGFGLQKTFGNLLAGIILLMDKSIKPGDVISVTDAAGNEGFGQIRKIGIRAISVVTRDKTEYLIPNENLMINQVVNWSYSSREVRVKAPVGVSYGSDIELVTELLYQAVRETPRVLESPPPRVNLMGFGDSSVDFDIRFWILDPEEGLSNIRSDVLMRVWHLFKEHDVEIPFPQRDLNLRDNAQFQQLVEAIAQRVDKSA